MKAQKVITLEDAQNMLGVIASVMVKQHGHYHCMVDGVRVKVIARRATDRQAYAARALSIETARLREQARAGTLYGRVIA